MCILLRIMSEKNWVFRLSFQKQNTNFHNETSCRVELQKSQEALPFLLMRATTRCEIHKMQSLIRAEMIILTWLQLTFCYKDGAWHALLQCLSIRLYINSKVHLVDKQEFLSCFAKKNSNCNFAYSFKHSFQSKTLDVKRIV